MRIQADQSVRWASPFDLVGQINWEVPAVRNSRRPARGSLTRVRRYNAAGWAAGSESVGGRAMRLRVELEREDDGRWIAEVPDVPGAMSYGASRDEAVSRVQAMTLR